MQEEMITLYHLRDWYGNVNGSVNGGNYSERFLSAWEDWTAAFFRPTPLGFRQVVQHVQLHVA